MTRAYLRDWADRWRYPGLVPVEAEDDDIQELSRAVLDGIISPVADRADAVRRLAALGRFAEAESLAADDDALQVMVERARDEAVQMTERIIVELQGRAQRAGISAEPPPRLIEDTRHSLPVVTGHLAVWRKRIEAAERQRTAELEQRLHAAGERISPTRAASVLQCLRLLEFGVAEQLIDAAEDDEPTLGPDAFPRPPAWPRQFRFEWYLVEAGNAPPRFNASWRPPEADALAWRVIRALDGLSRSPGLDSVRNFAAEFDALLGDADDSHWVEEAGEGIRTSIAGLQEPRLPNLALPRRFPLWFSPSGAAPPEDIERPVIWLAADGTTADAPPGTAIVPPGSLAPVLAPDRDGRPLTLAARRIAVFRAVCQQLRLADVIGPGDELSVGDTHTWHRDITWLLDLLGVRVSEGALDIIAFDTARHPVAVRALIEELVPDDGRPTEITGESLTDWHRDPVALSGFRDRVLNVVFRDTELQAVFAATLWVYGSSPGKPVTAADIEEALDLAQLALGEDTSSRYNRDGQPSAFVSLPRAIDKALDTGLLRKTGDSRYMLAPGGLTGLLAGDPECLLRHVDAALAELSRRSELIKKSLRSRLTMDAIRHLFDNHLSAFAELAISLSEWRTQLPRELTEKINYAISHYERMEDYRRAAEAAALQELQHPREFDVGVLMEELGDEHTDRRITVSVAWDGAPLMIRASRFMTKMAFENLIVNAQRAIAESDRPRGRIQLAVSRSDSAADAGSAEVIVEIKDTGPGIPADLLQAVGGDLDDPTVEESDGGLPQARKLLAQCGGSLLLVAAKSDLGGAHFRVQLPLAAAP